MDSVHHLPNERISLISATFGLAQQFLQTYKPQRKKRKIEVIADQQPEQL